MAEFGEIDFAAPSFRVARRLIGWTLLVDGIGGRIVETEAYDREDPASHSFAGPTPRNQSMFGQPGRVYVYRSYGIHWCVNFVCREAGHGAAVLIRALEPTKGLTTMRERRGLAGVGTIGHEAAAEVVTPNDRRLCNGPGNVCQALGITRAHDGFSLDAPPFLLLPPTKRASIVVGPRIGITKAVEVPWRFGLKGSIYLSRPFR